MLSQSPFERCSLYLGEGQTGTRGRERGAGSMFAFVWCTHFSALCCFHLVTCLAPPPPPVVHGFVVTALGAALDVCVISLIFWGERERRRGMLSGEDSRVSLLRFTVAHVSETPLATPAPTCYGTFFFLFMFSSSGQSTM